ncbi:MAG: hypothetical protein EOO75_02440 [Myxococcales bacterium]|nr:MAG: hypothetical protein EOO75_02440 [Myxococcales bacterium]
MTACTSSTEAPAGDPEPTAAETGDEDEVVVETETPEEWAQYQANLKFALDYKPKCPVTKTGRPRVIVSGYGRFMSNATNTTGQIISRLIPGAKYPVTAPPPYGEVDEPAPQTSVALGSLTLPKTGAVDVCALILPVSWDLAAILVLKEVAAFAPDLVIMNGIAGPTQPLWLELGSVNRAMAARDSSDLLAPVEGSPLIPQASQGDLLRGLRMSWGTVKGAAEKAIKAEAKLLDEKGKPLSDVITGGALLAGFPREGNTYLCNNVAYTVNYLMGYPGRSVRLLKASHPRGNAPNGISVKVSRDHRQTPREFIHWPSTLAGPRHLDAGARILAAIIDAQLTAQRSSSDRATVGTNEQAEISASGDTY